MLRSTLVQAILLAGILAMRGEASAAPRSPAASAAQTPRATQPAAGTAESPTDSKPPSAVVSSPAKRPSLSSAVPRDYLQEAPPKAKRGLASIATRSERGTLRVGGLLQAWYQADEAAPDSFRGRRGEVKLYGDMTDKVYYYIMFDSAKELHQNKVDILQSGRPLSDLYLGYRLGEHTFVDFGQYKIPVTKEGRGSSGKLDFAERAIVTRTYGDRRDQGLQVRHESSKFELRAAILDGEELNRADTNDAKDVTGMISWHPNKRLEAGASVYRGRQAVTLGRKDRTGVELEWKPGRWDLKGEYTEGQDFARRSAGWYTTAAYTLGPRWQLALRREAFEADRSIVNGAEHATTLGANYFLDGHFAKVQLNYIARQESPSIANDQAILAMQVAF
ncbi:MAG: hypothetical protein HY303_13080 [Candidatus Wallbacteria bacterium]|nr:hypothetical protein [Candidatus Wallbacteria bacterium]